MLIKKFLNNIEHKELLDWAKTLNYYAPANGSNVFNYYLINSYLPLLDKIINKVNKIYDKNYNGFKINLSQSCMIKMNPKGWINLHTDKYLDKEVINFNILLDKLEEDGQIIHGNKKVLWQNKDAYILDALIPHGVSSVKSNNIFYSILLYYGKS
jgi:hypothetical protein